MSFAHYYENEWVHQHAYFAHHRQRFLQTFDAVMDLGLAPGRLLDVGGVGPVASYLARNGWQAEGTLAELRGPLPLTDGVFDLILCTEVIEHIKDQDSTALSDLEAFNYSGVMSMLRELRRALRPQGLLLITTPNAASWHMLAKWLYGELLLADPNHVREFTPFELIRVAGLCGLRPALIKTIDSWSQGQVPMLEWVASAMRADASLPLVERGDNIVAMFARS
jgi:SAM-dependent methyltransferase